MFIPAEIFNHFIMCFITCIIVQKLYYVNHLVVLIYSYRATDHSCVTLTVQPPAVTQFCVIEYDCAVDEF
jgi:hypothetical protein